jgi:hypothetical protein
MKDRSALLANGSIKYLDLSRCPQCGIANPTMEMMYRSPVLKGKLNTSERAYVMWMCTTCGDCIMSRYYAELDINVGDNVLRMNGLWPVSTTVSSTIPQPAGRYLQQAMDSLAAPDGATMLAASAILAMLKAKGHKSSQLFEAINLAIKAKELTPELAAWAHKLRLDANDPRHADDNSPHRSVEEARELVAFATMLAEIWFVLPTKIQALSHVQVGTEGETPETAK